MNMKKQGLVKRVLTTAALLLLMGVRAVALPNSVTIRDTSGSNQVGRPFSISRVFAPAEFPSGSYPQARLGGSTLLTTQVDVKNTWGDGSIKHAIVSFVTSIPAGSTISIDFVTQSTSNTTGYLTQAQMLAFNGGTWDAGINTSAGNTSARTMVNALPVPSTNINTQQVRYWLRGSVVTQVIAEDKSTALAYDFGTDSFKANHPVFVLTFYPTTSVGVRVEYIVENSWLNKWEDQTYSTTLTANGSTVFTKASFTYIAGTRWRKMFWAGTAPTGWTDETNPGVIVNLNLPYIISTGALPNYDTTKVVSAAAISSELSDYASHSAGEEPQFCVTNTSYCGSYTKNMGATGGRGELGWAERWFLRYLYTFSPSLYPVFVNNSLATGRFPIHERDSDNTTFFDSTHTATSFGRPFSVDAHPLDGVNGTPGSITPVAPVTLANFNIDPAHEPALPFIPYLVTGDWYFLEELYAWTSRNLHWLNPCINDHFCRHQDWGFVSNTVQIRGMAWLNRNLANTAFMAPDGTPEQFYYTQKHDTQIEIWEGTWNITNGSFPPADASCPNYNVLTTTDKWCWGRKTVSTRTGAGAANPLGFADQGDPYSPTQNTGIFDSTKAGTVPLDSMFEQNIVQLVLGHIKEMGFAKTDSALQAYWARWNISVILDPAVNPYHIGDYAFPIVQSNNGPWITSWTAWSGAYLSTYDPQAIFISRSTDPQFGYPHIAYAALSYASGITGYGGLLGDNAWNWIKMNLPNQSLQNDNPMWAIVPRGSMTPSVSMCDLDSSGTVDVLDVQISINRALGLGSCGNGDLNQDGTCNAVDIQRIINAALGSSCRVGP
jgi:hypothetical protein